jgi:dTDP-glucose 4,6-dehydratase
MLKTITVTGCLGFIGSHFVDLCLENDWKVIGIDNLTYAANCDLIETYSKHDNFLFIKEDIAKLTSLHDTDFIVNFAAESHVENSIINSAPFLNTNIFGVQNLLSLISNKSKNSAHWPKFIHISTDEVYGDIADGEHHEESRLIPSNPYAASKASADMLIFSWARTFGVKYRIIRPTNNYGNRQYHEKLIPLCVRNLKRGRVINLHNKGTPVRNWLHVKDTVKGVMRVIEHGNDNEVYNIAGGFEQKNIDTVKKIIACYDDSLVFEDCVSFSHNRAGQDVRYALNDSKLRSLGWTPELTFDEEIENVVNHFKYNFKW